MAEGQSADGLEQYEVMGRRRGRCQNIENNPMQSSRRRPAFTRQLDTSGNSGILFYYSEVARVGTLWQALDSRSQCGYRKGR
ncbi:hypothetical protein ACVMB1_003110 [Bradyrhizobium sp. USDA 4504]